MSHAYHKGLKILFLKKYDHSDIKIVVGVLGQKQLYMYHISILLNLFCHILGIHDKGKINEKFGNPFLQV